MGSSKPATSTQNTQTATTTTPWAAAAPYFPDLYQTGSGALDKSQTAPLPTQFVAQENPTEAAAVQGTLDVAPNLGASGGALSDAATKIASGYWMNPMNDPTFQPAVNAAIQPTLTNVEENLLPNVINSAIKGGGVGGGPSAYGGANAGSAADIENERVLRDFGVTAGNIGAGMANNERNAALNLIPQAPGVAAGANTQLLAPSTTVGLAGTQEQQYGQNAIDDALQKYQYATQGPWAGIQNFVNLLTAGGYSSGTGSSQTQGTYTAPQPSLATQILQGALGAGGIAGSLFGVPTSGVSAAGNIFSLLSGKGAQ